MSRHRPRPGRLRLPRLVAVVLLGLLALGTAPVAADDEPAAGDRVEVLDVDGILDPTMARYIRAGLAEAAATDASVVVIQLDSPGALDVALDELAEDVARSPVPVVAYVGPAGAQLSGGGLALYQAAHVRAVAPATILGPASPTDLGVAARQGADDDLAAHRHASALLDRDHGWLAGLGGTQALVAAPPGVAELPDNARLPDGVAHDDARVVEADQLAAGPPADVAAASLPDVLLAVDGFDAPRLDPASAEQRTQPLAIDAVEATTRFNNLGLLSTTLHGLLNPALVHLLLVAGLLCLAFEWFQPGFGVAGVSGLGLLLAAGVGLWALPISWLGLALLVAGVLLLSLDTAAGGLGPVTAGGTLAFGAGSWLLFPGPEPVSAPLWLLALLTVAVVVFFVVVLTGVLRAQGQQAGEDAERLVGETAVVRSMLNPEGHVFVGGALWRAKAPDDAGRVATGTPVRVVGLDDRLTLEVEPLADDEPVSAGSS